MKYKVVYLPEARADAEEIRRYLSQYYQSTVQKFFTLLKQAIARLKANPLICERYDKRPAYRRMVVGDYLVFYKVAENEKKVEIHRILHANRDIGRYLS